MFFGDGVKFACLGISSKGWWNVSCSSSYHSRLVGFLFMLFIIHIYQYLMGFYHYCIITLSLYFFNQVNNLSTCFIHMLIWCGLLPLWSSYFPCGQVTSLAVELLPLLYIYWSWWSVSQPKWLWSVGFRFKSQPALVSSLSLGSSLNILQHKEKIRKKMSKKIHSLVKGIQSRYIISSSM